MYRSAALAALLVSATAFGVAINPEHFRATGNEPGWRLDIDDETLTLVTHLGETKLVSPTPRTEHADGITRYRVDGAVHALTVTVTDQRCADTMTGMPYPNRVVVELDGETLSGCGGDPAMLLKGGEWTVETIGGDAPVADSHVSLTFMDAGRIAGAASCNRFMGGYALSGEGLTLSQMGSTMMACEDAAMNQERRFLEILSGVNRFEISDDGALLLHASDGRIIKARRP